MRFCTISALFFKNELTPDLSLSAEKGWSSVSSESSVTGGAASVFGTKSKIRDLKYLIFVSVALHCKLCLISKSRCVKCVKKNLLLL